MTEEKMTVTEAAQEKTENGAAVEQKPAQATDLVPGSVFQMVQQRAEIDRLLRARRDSLLADLQEVETALGNGRKTREEILKTAMTMAPLVVNKTPKKSSKKSSKSSKKSSKKSSPASDDVKGGKNVRLVLSVLTEKKALSAKQIREKIGVMGKAITSQQVSRALGHVKADGRVVAEGEWPHSTYRLNTEKK